MRRLREYRLRPEGGDVTAVTDEAVKLALAARNRALMDCAIISDEGLVRAMLKAAEPVIREVILADLRRFGAGREDACPPKVP